MGLLLLLALAFSRPPSDDRLDVLFAPSGEKRLLEERLGDEIRSARRDIRVAMFHFTSERLLRALAERRRDGVDVRVLVDASQADDEFLGRLRRAGLQVRRVVPQDDRARFHHKFAVFDGKTAATGSYNWTVLADVASFENLVLLRHPAAAGAFRDEFDRIWQDQALSRP